MLTGNVQNLSHVTRLPCHMNRNDYLGSGGDRGFNLGRIDVESIALAIDENRFRFEIENHLSRSGERHRWQDNLVTFLEAHRIYCEMQGSGSGSDRNGMFSAD